MERGLLQGRLLALLEVRFGAPAPDIVARVKEATTDQVEDWLGRVTDAANPEAVFRG